MSDTEKLRDVLEGLATTSSILRHFTVDTSLHENQLVCDICNSEIFFMNSIDLPALVDMAHKHYRYQCPETRAMFSANVDV